jgi:polyphosphate kinase 2
MPNYLSQIFNWKIELNSHNLKIFLEELEKHFKTFKDHTDIDFIKVLRNKVENFLDKNKKEIKKHKNYYKKLKDILDEYEDYIEEIEKKESKQQTKSVVKEIEDDYKKCDKIDKDKRKDYKKSCIKKSKIEYEKELVQLQVELLKLQKYIKDNNEKLLIIFEWRDAAWKWWTIKRFIEHLNPRWARVVALNKPTNIEKSQWYFQRYIKNLPSWWEITFFDRSWYNRWWVEPVMWFCTEDEYKQFITDVQKYEKMLVDSWVKIIKFYFSVSKSEQAKRFNERKTNPLKQFKLSPIDQYSQQLWEKYTLAEYKNFSKTHSKHAPWTIIRSDNKKKARLNAIKYVLKQYDYPEKIDNKHLKLDKNIVMSWSQKAKILADEIDIKKDLFE